jgi:hypothetical protein
MGRHQAGDPAHLGLLVPMMLDEYLAALTASPARPEVMRSWVSWSGLQVMPGPQ